MSPNADSSELPPDPSSPIGIVRDGGYVLEVGGPSGTIVSRETRAEEPERAPGRRKDASEALEETVDGASSVTTKVERADALYEDLADGSVEAAQVDSAIGSLVGLLERLDREGKHEDALRVARTLSKLLSLARRWLALLKALRAALRVGEVLGDDAAVAWAKHELGTAHLVRGDLTDADRWLGEARELRERLGDRRGLAATTRNLETLCGRMRQILREKKLIERSGRFPLVLSPMLLAIFAIALAGAGVAAGALVSGAGGGGTSATAPDREGTNPGGGNPSGGGTNPGGGNPPGGGGPGGPGQSGKQRLEVSLAAEAPESRPANRRASIAASSSSKPKLPGSRRATATKNSQRAPQWSSRPAAPWTN